MQTSRAFSALMRAVLCCVLVLAVSAARLFTPGGWAVAAGMAARPASGSVGVAWMWGANGSGELGDGTTTNRLSPWRVPGLSGVAAIAAGSSHSLALAADGTVWAWGSNQQGQLGLGGSVQGSADPRQVPGLRGVRAVAAGSYFSLALAADGTVWAWGSNQADQLGVDRSVTYQSATPRQVPGLRGVRAIAAGDSFALALAADGTVWAWGDNQADQLGVDAGAVQSRGPAQQVPGLRDVRAIAAGSSHGLALKADGTVWAWGNNAFSQLGEDRAISGGSVTRPVLVPGLSGVRAVAAGDDFSLALAADGTVWAWGGNPDGELGASPSVGHATPQQIAGLRGVRAIAAGSNHGLALETDGSVWTWGNNEYGQLGDGTTNNRGTPAAVPGLHGMGAVAASYGKSMAFIPAGGNAPQPVIPTVPTAVPTRVPPPVARCAVVTVNTFDQCVEPGVMRVVKALPGGIIEQGSAFVIRSDATGTYLATNQHVVDGAGKEDLTVYGPDGHTKYAVTAVISTGGTDGSVQDLALIELQPTGLRPLPWGDSTKLHTLQPVVAVGYGDAFDLLGPPSVTQGSISATQRDLGKCGGRGWIQHGAPLSHGNSGGPLLDLQGHVIGINTLKFDSQSACPSLADLGFAIPSTPAAATLGTLARLLPGVQGGLIAAASSRSEIAAQRVPGAPASLPHLRFRVPLTWHQGRASGQFSSRDGRVTVLLVATTYRAAPTHAQLQADALRALRSSGPFAGMGVSPLSIDAFSGLIVTVQPAHQRYRGDALALLDSRHHVEVLVVRLVDPAASSQDRLETDSIVLSLVAVS